MRRSYVDLAQSLPEELVCEIGELTILFGRLEYMVLLCLKRKRELPLKEAQKRYKGYSLGSKLFGKKTCLDVGSACRNYDAEQGLYELASENNELKGICKKIQMLTAERNKLMHGLITTVEEDSVVFHNQNTHLITGKELCELKFEVANVIERLNEIVSVPGLSASITSEPGIDMRYDEIALNINDPIAKLADK